MSENNGFKVWEIDDRETHWVMHRTAEEAVSLARAEGFCASEEDICGDKITVQECDDLSISWCDEDFRAENPDGYDDTLGDYIARSGGYTSPRYLGCSEF